jgi:hypothetical protein
MSTGTFEIEQREDRVREVVERVRPGEDRDR